MRRTLQVLAAGLLLAGCTRTGPPARVTVGMEMADGRCTISTPETIVFHGGGRAVWRFTNGCGTPQRLTIRDFEVKALGGSEWPFDTEATEASCNAASGKSCQIELNVLSLAGMRERRHVARPGAWVYRYTIRTDAGTGDPEIIIDWPMM